LRNPFRRRLKADQVVQSKKDVTPYIDGTEFVSVPTGTLKDMIAAYVAVIETHATRETCYCEWITHPSDVDLPRDRQRAQLKEHHDWCPVHEKQGFLLGFFVFMFGDQVPSGKPKR
jgi:hypothetical protein